MEAHYQFSDHEFEKQFEQLAFEPKLFTHEAHLRLAWIHINKYGIETAMANICKQIKAFATSVGEPSKFNLTLTTAAIRIVHHFILRSNTTQFSELLIEEPRLKYGFTDLIKMHYSLDVLHQASAKKCYMEPDIIPFD